jgi:RimJ/RimL family protein N-acetyltransferase
VLRALVEADALALLDLREWLRAAELDAPRGRLRGWESRVSPDGSEGWLSGRVVGRDDGAPRGWVQATVRAQSATVAYAVLPGRRGAGVGAEALAAVTAWLHGDAAIAVVQANIAPSNPASQGVARRAGFVRTERLREGEEVWEHGSA